MHLKLEHSILNVGKLTLFNVVEGSPAVSKQIPKNLSLKQNYVVKIESFAQSGHPIKFPLSLSVIEGFIDYVQ